MANPQNTPKRPTSRYTLADLDEPLCPVMWVHLFAYVLVVAPVATLLITDNWWWLAAWPPSVALGIVCAGWAISHQQDALNAHYWPDKPPDPGPPIR